MIWCLFSIDNNYDQPDNNLVAWWKLKPPLKDVATAIGLKFPGNTDEETVQIVNIWSGKEVRVRETDYRLQYLINTGPVPDYRAEPPKKGPARSSKGKKDENLGHHGERLPRRRAVDEARR